MIPLGAAKTTARPKASVLIADDDFAVRRAVALALEPTYDVVTAASAPEAVRLCRQLHPDVALVDVSMPGGGFYVLAQVIDDEPPPKVVFLTAINDCQKAAYAMQLGASDYLVKPCSASHIREAIEAVLCADHRALLADRA